MWGIPILIYKANPRERMRVLRREAGYEATMFDQRTGWSRFLKRNNVALQY